MRGISASWLVALALLVPLAQSLAAWHAQSHFRADSAQRGNDQPGVAHDHCDLCLLAADLGTGGPPAAILEVAADEASSAPPTTRPWREPKARPPAFYSSRAPPPAFI